MANIWLQQADLENATSVQSVLGAFDDGNVGAANPTAVQSVITRAEGQLLGWLDELGPPPFSTATLTALGADPLLKGAALEYAIAYMVDRRPEYFRSSAADVAARLVRADAGAERIKQGRQRPPTVAIPPANVGGVSVDNANRIYVDSPGGPAGGNAGDY